MQLKCEVVEKISQKGNNYICLEIYITDTYKKQVFLENAELELIRLSNINKHKQNN